MDELALFILVIVLAILLAAAVLPIVAVVISTPRRQQTIATCWLRFTSCKRASLNLKQLSGYRENNVPSNHHRYPRSSSNLKFNQNQLRLDPRRLHRQNQ
jgi:hypothetical protein